MAVRAEPFGKGVMEGRGGLCWVDGQPLVVMDDTLVVMDRIGVLARALGQLDLEGAAVTPQVRERIEATRRVKKRRASKKPSPGLARARARPRAR